MFFIAGITGNIGGAAAHLVANSEILHDRG
jgi:hypothetical protein